MNMQIPAVGRHSLAWCIAVAVGLFAGMCHGEDEPQVAIIDRVPFDRITLNAANDNATIDVQLLEFKDRKVPDPLPTSGMLELRRLSDPSTQYEVSWSDVAKVELYEQLVLNEAAELISAGKLETAFQNLSFLHENYPELSGLKELTEQYLQRDAKATFDKGQYDESLSIMAALYDLDPQRPGIGRAVEGISDRLINGRLADRDFDGARGLLDALGSQFPDLKLANIETWRQKFVQGAERQLVAARQALAAGKVAEARQAIQRSLKILPNAPGADELLIELKKRAPQIAIGVAQEPTNPDGHGLQTWANERVGRLTNPQFVELVRVGPEGGEYACRWAEIVSDDSGMRLELRFNSQALTVGISPGVVALQLVRMADPDSPEYRHGFADVFRSVEIRNGQTLIVNWRYPYLKPVALLRFSIAELHLTSAEPIAYTPTKNSETPALTTYRRAASDPDINEELFVSDHGSLEALRKGDLDVVDQVPPWQLAEAKQAHEIVLGTYRMPTVHVLLCNYENPLLKRREFRRALCYGIDRPRMVTEILAGKEATPGFRALSGPVPAGVKVNDVLGYAYKQELQPLPYEPRLAVVLGTTARTTLAKQALLDTGEKNPVVAELPKPDPLVLLHPTDAVARTMCGLIKKQLDAIGIPVELKEQSAAGEPDWDLKYAELCLWEPLLDMGQLLGPGGLAGHSSPAMILALRELNESTNWNDARARLQRVHQLAYDDLPVLPLWQTVNYFAYRDSVSGMSREPVSVYQDVGRWQLTYGLAEAKR